MLRGWEAGPRTGFIGLLNQHRTDVPNSHGREASLLWREILRVRGFNKGAAAQSGSQLAGGGVREGDGNCDEGELQLFS